MNWRNDLQGKSLEEEEEAAKSKLIQFLFHWVNSQWWLLVTEIIFYDQGGTSWAWRSGKLAFRVLMRDHTRGVGQVQWGLKPGHSQVILVYE